jgi:predicted NBD/HSP70 family sugar kinase
MARNDAMWRSRVVFRITKTGIAAGFVLDVDVASVSSHVAGSLVNTVVDPDAFLYDTHCMNRRVDGQQPADHRLVRVPAGRALRVSTSSMLRNGVSVTSPAHVAQRVVDAAGRSLLGAGSTIVDIPKAAGEQIVIVELTAPQLLVGGTDTLQAKVCIELR